MDILSENFSWEEVVTTQHREIDNSLPDGLKSNVAYMARQMERVRALLNTPVIVNSWYRCPELNKVVGGVPTSDHLTGLAVDFISPKFGSCAAVAKRLSEYTELIKFNQLILEHSWVHISIRNPLEQGKGEVLSLLASGGYSKGLTDKFGARLYG